MARKKNRSQRPSRPGSDTAVMPQSAVTGLTAKPAVKVLTVTAPAAVGNLKKEDRFWLEVWAVRMARTLGSLQIAVFGLSLFAIVLMVGTVVESWYSGRVAQELIYRTWWFVLLLTILGVNIFFAAVKKWPWKKHQTGFLITHLGLITMVSGGIFNSLWGTDSLMTLVDSEQRRVQRYVGAPQESSRAIDKDEAQIVVTRTLKNGKQEPLSYAFRPGSLAWRSDEYLDRKVHPLLAVLDWLAYPLPRHWTADLGRGAELDVLAYYPHARREKFSPAEKGDGNTFPAVKFTLTSPFAGNLPDSWVALTPDDQSFARGAASVEMLNECPAELLKEFLSPPSADQLGKKGQLVLSVGGEAARFNVDQQEGQPAQPLGKSGWKARIIGYTANLNGKAQEVAAMPAVEFELTAPDGKTSRWQALAAYGSMAIASDSSKSEPSKFLRDVAVWYNVADNRWGNETVRGVLQFTAGEDGKLYYRSFNSHDGGFHYEKSGAVATGEPTPIWKGMDWKFRVSEFLPTAVLKERYVPLNLRPGQEDVPGVVPAIRCRLSVGKDAKEFWLGQTDASSRDVSVGGESFQVAYNTQSFDVGFTTKLLRAEQRVDPGTQQAATFTSYVQITDEKNKVFGEDRMITMNQPLEYNGYKLFQSNYQLIDPMDPSTNKPVSYSGFTVSRDPGLWLKYIGSTMLALGIACMFYMKAYFFKPRGRKTSTTIPTVGGEPA
jgi:hypothetical protein